MTYSQDKLTKSEIDTVLICKVAKGTERLSLEKKFQQDLDAVFSAWFNTYLDEIFSYDFQEIIQELYKDAVGSSSLPSQQFEYFKASVYLFFGKIEKPPINNIREVIRKYWWKAFDFGINSALLSLGFMRKSLDDVDFDLNNSEVEASGEQHIVESTKQITDSRINLAKAFVVLNIFNKGNSIQSTMSGLSNLAHSPWRSLRIATTEFQNGVGYGRHEMFSRSGCTEKKRVTVGDSRVRPKHRADEQAGWIPMEWVFPASGVMYVGQGVDGIRCRCVQQCRGNEDSILSPWDGGGTSDDLFLYEEAGVKMYAGKQVFKDNKILYTQTKTDRARNLVAKVTPKFTSSLDKSFNKLKAGGGLFNYDTTKLKIVDYVKRGIPVDIPSVFSFNGEPTFGTGAEVYGALKEIGLLVLLYSLTKANFEQFAKEYDLSKKEPERYEK